MSAIFKRDLRAYFKSPLGYVYLAAFVLVLNIYFYLMNVYSGSSSLDGIFSFIVTMCVFLIPILTMRTFAEDYKQKTDQLLFTAPVRLTGIVLGKFFAATGRAQRQPPHFGAGHNHCGKQFRKAFRIGTGNNPPHFALYR